MNTAGIQSAAHTAEGSGAALINELSLVLYVGATVIFIGVMVLLARAVFSKARPVNSQRWILWGGAVFPTVTLAVLTVYSLAVGATLADMNASGPLRFILNCISGGARALTSTAATSDIAPVRIDIVARQWWWEVRYQASDGNLAWVTLANELHLPAGRPADITLRTDDVIHSFWVPSLAGKMDMIPGRINRLTLRASKEGVYRGQCAEYCGGQHALMAFYVIVRPEPEFNEWLAGQAQLAAVPDDPFLKLGHDAFMRGGCAECHTVRGTVAAGRAGPDLTHVGSRHSLAAGVLRNHMGTMAGWIADAQTVKPGNRMPSMPIYSGEELRAVAAWMESLQ